MNVLRLFRTVQSKLVIIYVLLILIAMQLIGVYFVRTLESYFVDNFSDSLRKQTVLLAEFVEPYLSNNAKINRTDLPDTAKQDIKVMVDKLFTISGAEIQVIDVNGIVLSSSLATNSDLTGKKNTQTEVSRALQGIRLNESVLIDSDGLRKKMIATPVGGDGNIVGAIFLVASMEEMYANMSRINQILLSATGIALVLTALLGVFLAHTITAPIKQMRKSTTAIAEGQFDQYVEVHGSDEIGELAESFNFMTSRLKEALFHIEEEKEKLALILANMSDGVIAADEYGRLIVMNHQARQMFSLKDSDDMPRNMARLFDLSWIKIKEYAEWPQHAEMMVLPAEGTKEEQIIRVMFTSIRRKDKQVTGIIAVLQDVTKQQRLEQQRKDFVANVSHELRTPLTTIKSYLEALVEDDALAEPELAERFLGVARNETERMIRLVQDLLRLSQLERPEAALQLSTLKVADLLEEVSDRFAFQLQQKQISLVLQIAADLPEMEVDRDQMDQVLDNLLSNAIKFTGPEGRIELAAQLTDGGLMQISVTDNGMGIPAKDIAFIFDRFYRVDKARSRNLGGTGLGLSIAQTIIQAHGGSISLESEQHVGTRVTFALPIGQVRGESHA